MNALRVPQPISTRTAGWANLTENVRKAIEAATEEELVNYAKLMVRTETYTADDIRYLLGTVWGWAYSLADVYEPDDRERVEVIMGLLPDEGVWPYVSHWATGMDELMERSFNGSEYEVLYHGDGWHRIIAQLECGYETIDIVYPLC